MSSLKELVDEGNRNLARIKDYIYCCCMGQETYNDALKELKNLGEQYKPNGSFNNTPQECYKSAIDSTISEVRKQLYEEANESRINRDRK